MKRLMILAFAVLLCPALRAQSFNLATRRLPVVSLDGLWRFHPGDDPRWADSNFDDSHWALLRSGESWAQQGYPGLGGYAWYRFKLQVPDGRDPISLLLMGIRTSYRVYADGKLIGGYGYFPPHSLTQLAWPEIYSLPASNLTGPRTIQIAIRVWHDPFWASYAPGGSLRPGNIAGNSRLIHTQLDLITHQILFRITALYVFSILTAFFGLLVLSLYFYHPADREYLWFSLVLLAFSADTVATILGMHRIPVEFFDLLDGILTGLSLIAALLFFARILRLRRTFWWWFSAWAAALTSLTVFLYWSGLTSVPISGTATVFLVLPAQTWIIVALLHSAARKDPEARLLLFPVLLTFGYYVANNLVLAAYQFNWQHFGAYINPMLLRQPFPVPLEIVINTVFAVSMMLFLVRRFSLARKEEERLASEVEAAKGIQSLLIPAIPPATPGFSVETIYLPATEVGGDFFHIQPSDEGSLLIVAGDVSGKGLKAAMTVSTIIGALRNESSRQPATVLANLNRLLHGNIDGFAVCTAALVSVQGAVTLANAGNPAPYCNGEEMSVKPGLPLGVTPESAYTEFAHQLSPGDRLTFISDGVVEAINEKRELFGFERTQAISNQPAAFIADAARLFGQKDDISVISVVCTGAATAAV